jgi:hypothetical protein
MGPSRDTASRALGVFRGFQRDGVQDTLLRLNLGNLVGPCTLLSSWKRGANAGNNGRG